MVKNGVAAGRDFFFFAFLREKFSHLILKEYSGLKWLKELLLGSAEVLSKAVWAVLLLHFLLRSAQFGGSSLWGTRTSLCIPVCTTKSQSKLFL